MVNIDAPSLAESYLQNQYLHSHSFENDRLWPDSIHFHDQPVPPLLRSIQGVIERLANHAQRSEYEVSPVVVELRLRCQLIQCQFAKTLLRQSTVLYRVDSRNDKYRPRS